MYVLVHHRVTDPQSFWARAQQEMPSLPAGLTLHQTLSASDGSRATCLWEAASVDAVRTFLEPRLGDYSMNDYAEAENREGVAVPASYAEPAAPPSA